MNYMNSLLSRCLFFLPVLIDQYYSVSLAHINHWEIPVMRPAANVYSNMR